MPAGPKFRFGWQLTGAFAAGERRLYLSESTEPDKHIRIVG